MVCEPKRAKGPPDSPLWKQEGKEAALKEYHALMAGCQPMGEDSTVAALLDRFLEVKKPRWAEGTYTFYRDHLSSFARFICNLRVSHLKPHHVTDWLNHCHGEAKYKGKPTGKQTSDWYRYNLIRTVKAAFRWAEREGQASLDGRNLAGAGRQGVSGGVRGHRADHHRQGPEALGPGNRGQHVLDESELPAKKVIELCPDK